MRLLNAETYQLEEWVGSTPRYAILSHTWEDEEVVFADFLDRKLAEKKKGFDKIIKTCQQAVKDGFDWVRIDTCCIDKSSSAELSEAINSMFAWYKGCDKCYAYLADVGREEEEDKSTANSIALKHGGREKSSMFKDTIDEDGFKGSKWFTRAWTLQELLAPSNVRISQDKKEKFSGMEFFDSNWKSLGTKESLSRVISAVTGIAEGFLKGQSLHDASISMRMSWAAERRATRAEDIAYSLLGIFDVNMPLLYGEGKVKAFRRLQEEIMKISEDETLFAWDSELMADDSSGDALAGDPKDFIEARDLIPYPSDDNVAPYALTHRGLRIWLQMKPFSEEIRALRSPVMIRLSPFQLYAAVLRCHVAHDFNHVVVIPLSHMTANLYVRDKTTNIGLLPVKYVSQPGLALSEVYIKNTRIPTISNSLRRRFGFLIRKLPEGFSIASAFPKESWDTSDNILQGDHDGQGLRSWHGCLRLELKHSSNAALSEYSKFLGLGCRQESGDSEPKAWCHLDDRIWPPGHGNLKAFHEVAFVRPQRYSIQQLRTVEGVQQQMSLKLTVTRDMIFGQHMFVVDIDLAENDNLVADIERPLKDKE